MAMTFSGTSLTPRFEEESGTNFIPRVFSISARIPSSVAIMAISISAASTSSVWLAKYLSSAGLCREVERALCKHVSVCGHDLDGDSIRKLLIQVFRIRVGTCWNCGETNSDHGNNGDDQSPDSRRNYHSLNKLYHNVRIATKM